MRAQPHAQDSGHVHSEMRAQPHAQMCILSFHGFPWSTLAAYRMSAYPLIMFPGFINAANQMLMVCGASDVCATSSTHEYKRV
jgi:hypothetical protein